MVKKSKRIQERDAALGALGAGNSDGIEVQNDSASAAAHQEGDVEQSSRRGKGGRAKGSSNGNRGPRNDGTDNENGKPAWVGKKSERLSELNELF